MLGQGGSADVYLGEHIHLGTLAAIKVLRFQIGTRLWTTSTRSAIDSSPAIANGVLYIGSNDGYLYALHLAGTTS